MSFKRNQTISKTLEIGSDRIIEKPTTDDWLGLPSGLYLLVAERDLDVCVVEWDNKKMGWYYGKWHSDAGDLVMINHDKFNDFNEGGGVYGDDEHFISILKIKKIKNREEAVKFIREHKLGINI